MHTARSSTQTLPASTIEPESSAASASQSNPPSQDVLSLKRRVTALEVENAKLLSKVTKKVFHSYLREGRAVRRLVTLVEPISDMIAENDRRQLLMVGDGTTLQVISANSSPEQERTYKNFQKLLEWCPSLRKALEVGEIDPFTCREFQTGADGARGDDSSTLKGDIIDWLEAAIGQPTDPPLSRRDKGERGFNHMATGGLLCPVDYQWTDPLVRQSIREYDPEFRVTAHSWPAFLYPKGGYVSEAPSKGLFQGELLVRAFKCIFTSPTSARRHIGVGQAVHSDVPRSHHNNAALLRMKSVQPRSIAYIVVQVRFALSSSSSWAIIDDDFNYEDFYYNIVDYFEEPSSEEKTAEVKKLLLWWNREVFGRRNSSNYHPLQTEALSVARSRK